MGNSTTKLLWLATVFGMALALRTCDVRANPLADQGARMGVKAPLKVYSTIELAAKTYGLDPRQMLAIAFIESSLNSKAIGYNKNGTLDIGIFQINERTALSDCEEFNVYNLKGNCLCAAKLLAGHKKSGDAFYIGRYHSKIQTLKLEYYRKVQGVK